MKTIKQLLITLAVLLCSATASAYDFEVDGIYYNILSMSDLTVEVKSGDNKYSGEVIIPSTVSYKSKTLTVTSIGDYAFKNCSGLTSITIPNSVTSIEYDAFYNCSGLTSITIPNSVTSIRSCAFYNCSGLTSVVIPNSVTSIGESAFRDCTKLRSITIPNSVTSISSMVFYGCSGLTSVVIPNSVTSIGDYAFKNCDILLTVINLSSLTLTKGSREYGFVAYYANEVIHIPNGDVVDDFIFSTSDNKHTLVKYFGSKNVIILPEDYNGDSYAIGDYAFQYCDKLTSITIPSSVTSIGESAFYYCSSLTSITIPNSVTSIGKSAFCLCKGLTSVTIGNSVTSIGKSAFQYCTKLRSITIPNSVTSIGYGAFFDCSGLTSVTIGNSVTSIGDQAFGYCDKLTSIYLLGKTPPTVGISSFTNKQYVNTRLYVPQGSLATYQSADTWKNFWDIQEFDATGIEDVIATAYEITTDGIQFTAADGKAVAIYTVAGALVEKIDSYAGEEIALDKGVYIVRVGNKTMKVKL